MAMYMVDLRSHTHSHIMYSCDKDMDVFTKVADRGAVMGPSSKVATSSIGWEMQLVIAMDDVNRD